MATSAEDENFNHAGTYRFVRHADVPGMQALGWEMIGDMPGHHKFWSALMKWAGDGGPITGFQTSAESSAGQ
jgi:hypothetical protein